MQKRLAILNAAKDGLTSLQLAENYCLIGSSHVSLEFEEQMIAVTKEVADYFQVSPRSMQLCGSAKLGFSLIKDTDFKAGESDLDIAILDPACFGRYLEIVASETGDLQDQTLFPSTEHFRRYKSLLSRGIIRSEMLPSISAKSEWDMFFNKLSIKHETVFSKISAAVYLSDKSFVRKQSSSFERIIEESTKI